MHISFSALIFMVLTGVFIVKSQPQFFKLPSYLPPPYPWVKHLYVAYQTHLDVGFTNFAKNVCETYFFHNYPLMFETARTLEYMKRPEKVVYTSHPWMILEFLDGTAHCTDVKRTSSQIKQMEDAIQRGIITWHAKPFTMLAEIADADLFEEGIKLSRILDKRFNQSIKITAAHKDVPGISRSTIPIFAKQGVEAIHIGVNGACLPPALPAVFRWRYNGDELLVLLYGGETSWGYGGNITLPNSDVALIYNFTVDNSEPQTVEAIIEQWQTLKVAYPNAEIHAGNLDDFVIAFKKDPAYQTLPIYEGEMGNTWLYGAGADPMRVSLFREIRRTMMEFEKQYGKVSDIDTTLRRLMNIPEHNWGLTMAYLDHDHYAVYWSNEAFHAHRNDPSYQMLQDAWKEKRSYLQTIPQVMLQTSRRNPNATLLANIIANRLSQLIPKIPKLSEYDQISINFGDTISTKYFDLQLDSTGAIAYLNQKSPIQYLWADSNHILSKFIYQTFTYEDFHIFNSVYNERCGEYICGDFGKVSMNDTYSIHADWDPTVLSVFQKQYPDRFELLVELKLYSNLSDIFGAPRMIYLTYIFSNLQPQIDITLKWFEKTATRLPEAMWLKFNPRVPNPQKWLMDVMGSPVSPYEVVVNGSRHLHAIWKGITYNNTDDKVYFSIDSLDANLVAPGDTDHLLFFDGASQPNVEGGMHFNIFNNLWGTAFPQWYDEDALFRFTLYFGFFNK